MRVLVALVVLFSPLSARADAVGPPPSCPPGTEGEVCHGLEYCRIDGCAGSMDCAPGEVCAARDFCIGTGMCFGRGGGGTTVSTVIAAGCEGCAHCESHFVCAPGAIVRDAGRPDAGRSDAGRMDAGSSDDRRLIRYCGCSVPTAHDRAPIALALMFAAVFLSLAARRR